MGWLHHLWYGYFVPSLWGNGPEAIFQTVLYGAIALIFVPPLRHFVERHVKSIHEKLDHQHQERIDQADHHHKEALALARKHHAEHMVALSKPAPGQARNEKGRFT